MPILYPPGRSYGAKFHLAVTSVPVVAAFQLGWSVLPGATAASGTVQDLVGTGTWVWNGASSYSLTGLNGLPFLSGDGTSTMLMNTSVALAAPGTTPVFVWGVMRIDTWANNRVLFGGQGLQNAFLARLSTSTPQARAFNGSNGGLNGGATIGQWFRFEAYYSNSASDYLKIGASSVTGTPFGNDSLSSGVGAGMQILGGNTSFSASSVSTFFMTTGLPTAVELSNLSALTTSVFGGLVAV